MQSLSVIEPVSVAVQRTKRILFEPFALSKWLRLGFCAFLMGSTGPTGLFSGGPSDISSDSRNDGFNADQVLFWAQEHPLHVLGLGLVAVLALIALTLLFTWLSSRGRFMLLDGVIHNRGAILAPWHSTRRQGNSLFRFRVVVGLISLVLLALIVAGVLLFSLPDLQAGVFTPRLLIAALAGLGLLLGWLLVMQVIAVLLLDFVVPVMLLRQLPVLRAWPIVIHTLVRPQPWGFVLYLLVRIVIDWAITLVAILATLFSCFLALIPYVGAVLLLPLTLFQISYPLAYLEQLGPQWQVFADDHPAAPVP